MKKTTKKSLAKFLALGLLVGGTGLVTVHQANADEATQNLGQAHGHPPQMRGHGFMQNVTRSVEKIDDGVVITLTSDDADIVQKLQEFENNADERHGPLQNLEDVTRTVTSLDNGVQITLTSDNAETVQKLQEGPKEGQRGGPHGPFNLPNVNHSVENTDNGVVITLSSDDPETVTKLQEMAAQMQEESQQ